MSFRWSANSVVDLHRLKADPEPDPDPSPSFTYGGKSNFFYTFIQKVPVYLVSIIEELILIF
jgi:hypothetical protein